MKKTNKNIYKWIFVVVWVLVIFAFSNMPSEVSDKQSDFVINSLNFIGIDIQSLVGQLATFLVRKAAHFTEYLVLNILIFNALGENMKFRKKFILAIVLSFFYACTDEFHQTFIPGRDGKFKDVMIDTSGALFSYVIIKLSLKLRK